MSAAAAWGRLRSTKLPISQSKRRRKRTGRGRARAAGWSPPPPRARCASPARSKVAVSARRPASASSRTSASQRARRPSGGKAERVGQAEPIAAEHRAQRRAAAAAGDVGRGEGIGEQRLHRGAGHAEDRAIAEREQGARQADLLDQQASKVAGSVAAQGRASGPSGISRWTIASASDRKPEQDQRAASSGRLRAGARSRRSSAAHAGPARPSVGNRFATPEPLHDRMVEPARAARISGRADSRF